MTLGRVSKPLEGPAQVAAWAIGATPIRGWCGVMRLHTGCPIDQ